MIRWNVTKHMRRKGWALAYDLYRHVGIPKPTARRVVDGAELTKIDVATLEALARAFRVKPWALLEYVED
jgi:DNA-binding Xre family transcriptional regulator